MGRRLETEVREQYEATRARWLRRAALVYFATLSLVTAALTGMLWARLPTGAPNAGALRFMAGVGAALQGVALLGGLGLAATRARWTRRGLLGVVFAAFGVFTLGLMCSAAPFAEAINAWRGSVVGHATNWGIGVPVMTGVLIAHLLGSLVLPWSAKEALAPAALSLGVFMLIIVLFEPPASRGMALLSTPTLFGLVVAPGVGVCAWRQWRFHERFHARAARERYEEVAGELDAARKIHERLFPEPIREGPLRLEFAYEPMRSIGGDLLYVRRGGEGGLWVVALDVTGHGIAAALAVNRLAGEMDRYFGDTGAPTVTGALRALNRYIGLTLSADGVFATAVCLELDAARSTARWASAGHPSVMLTRADGASEMLESTTFMLGVADGPEFDEAAGETRLSPGDRLLAMTDGAIETLGADGRQFGVAGWRRALSEDAGSAEGRVGRLLARLLAWRDGPAQDDTLLVDIRVLSGGAGAHPQ